VEHQQRRLLVFSQLLNRKTFTAANPENSQILEILIKILIKKNPAEAGSLL